MPFFRHFFFWWDIVLAFGPIKKPLRPNRAFMQYFQIPAKIFLYTRLSSVFSFLGEFCLKMKKTLDKRLYKKILAGIWKYCMKALLGLSVFLIGPKASTISHQKKKCPENEPFWNPHFRAEIGCLTAWSAGKALVQTILVGNESIVFKLLSGVSTCLIGQIAAEKSAFQFLNYQK